MTGNIVMLWLHAAIGRHIMPFVKVLEKCYVMKTPVLSWITIIEYGGYPWTVIPIEMRNAYMTALEEASVSQNIVPFAEFLARLVDDGIKGKSIPKIPVNAGK